MMMIIVMMMVISRVEAIIQNLAVTISPSEQMILKGVVTIIKCLLEGCQKFTRWCKGSCIPVEEVRVKGQVLLLRRHHHDNDDYDD